MVVHIHLYVLNKFKIACNIGRASIASQYFTLYTSHARYAEVKCHNWISPVHPWYTYYVCGRFLGSYICLMNGYISEKGFVVLSVHQICTYQLRREL